MACLSFAAWVMLAGCAGGELAPPEEICSNGVDDDRNGAIDDGCACAGGAQQACYPIEEKHLEQRPCQPGVQLCVEQAGAWRWGDCEGAVLPVSEHCGDGIDNDCDGEADNAAHCACNADERRVCYFGPSGTRGVGSCRDGEQQCTKALVWGRCEGQVLPAEDDDSCDNVDQDCDGEVDEDFVGEPARCGVGACEATGQRVCRLGQVSDECTPGPPTGADDDCDGIDDNCDGSADERYAPRDVSCGQGVCLRQGTTACEGGAEQQICEPGPATGLDDDCDGIDEDCDGQADEHFVATPTGCGIGACASSGSEICSGGEVIDTCKPGDPDSDDDSCDGIDDDCDGQPDEDYVPGPTTCGKGVCQSEGTASCEAGEEVKICTPGTPTGDDDDCDGVDDDCDGQADEHFAGVPCDGDDGDLCPEGTTRCSAGSIICDDATATNAEQCNAQDDDCDGQIDEDGACPCPVEYRDGHVYLYCSGPLDWPAARAYCQARGYDLVKLDDGSENSWAFGRATAHDAAKQWWTGLNDRTSEAEADASKFRWTDGTPPFSSPWPWHAGEPNNFSEEDCVLFNYQSGAGWNDAQCSSSCAFICEASP